jgi:hypothetical protein
MRDVFVFTEVLDRNGRYYVLNWTRIGRGSQLRRVKGISRGWYCSIRDSRMARVEAEVEVSGKSGWTAWLVMRGYACWIVDITLCLNYFEIEHIRRGVMVDPGEE